MRDNGGYATLRRLSEIVDFSSWKTKTPEASVRRIVQENPAFFKIEPGLWALKEYEQTVLKRFEIKKGDKKTQERFTHGYYQGLLVEIGKMSNHTTYVPPQDKSRIFIDKTLGDVVNLSQIPPFTYQKIVDKAKTVDVIWFHDRMNVLMPSDFYEVEHTTDIKNSLQKFYELQDFHSRFFIVADESRKREFEDKISASIFEPIQKRVFFKSYQSVVNRYQGMKLISESGW